ncbi:YqaJ viral recombinase family protein [Thiohalocapsa marina]|uniref:YqaJ viral recombinase family nuclease n=1 Tax=Thiohalocapsa marina TaxID=424902 RepID=UPI0036D9F432
MKIIDIAQRTPEWERWRAQGITASEAAIILDRSPYKTRWRLWAERTGLARAADLSRNPQVQRGTRMEDAARQWFEQAYDTLLMPLCGEAEETPILRASFDGINDAGEPVELKVPSAKTYRAVCEQGREADAYRLYLPQLQHQLYVSGADKGYLVFHQDAQTNTVFEIARDTDLIETLVEQSLAFWALIEQRREPAKDPLRDLYLPPPEQAEDWSALAGRYRAASREARSHEAALKRCKRELEALQTDLVAMMGEALIGESAGLRITRFCANGSVDYPALIEALLPQLPSETLEQFRRKPTERVRVTVQEDAAKATIDFDAEAVAQAANQSAAKDFYF